MPEPFSGNDEVRPATFAAMPRASGNAAAADVSPERVQLLLVTLAIATGYLVQVLRSADATGPPGPPLGWTALVAASNGIYLAGKAVKSFRARRDKHP